MLATRDSQQNTLKGLEDSLFEHTTFVVNLLIMATHKDNLSSPYLVERLGFLKQRLDDFLCPKVSGLTVAKCSQPGVLKIKTEDTGVLDKCGISNSPVTIYNGDHKLSMDQHCQAEVHQSAVPRVDDNLLFDVNSAKGHNTLHNDIGMKFVNKHVKVIPKKKKKKMKTAEISWSQIPVEWKSHENFFVKNDNGSLFCKPCAAVVDNNGLLLHLRGKRHTAICKQNPTKKKPKIIDVWSTFPKELQHQKTLFQSSESGMFYCKVCCVKVLCARKTLIEHVLENHHIERTDAFLWVCGVEKDNHCILCGLWTINKGTMIEHVASTVHHKKLQEKQYNVWSLKPEMKCSKNIEPMTVLH